MTVTAPHLVRPLATVVPQHPHESHTQAGLVRSGFMAGDLLRRAAGTPAGVLPRSRRVSASRTHQIAGGIREAGLRGGILAYDGQLIDDARLVVTIARTAAAHGAMILTRARAGEVTGTGARITDTLTQQTMTLTARTVVSAAGVWSGEVDPTVRLRPSRGTHLVLPAAALGHPTASITVPVEGSMNRFVFAMPEQLDRVYLGLTDEEAPGRSPTYPGPPTTRSTSCCAPSTARWSGH
jgi:glycerol-3-phosphate dehydrogenase